MDDDGGAVLGDFGISRIDDEHFKDMSSNILHGNARWQALELMMGENKASKESDLWAFGVLCMEVLTGNRPYHWYAADAAVIISVFNGERFQRPSEEQLGGLTLPDQLWSHIQSCWETEPSMRPSAEIMVRVLRDTISDAEQAISTPDNKMDCS